MTQYGHDGQHHGRGTPDCPTELHHHHDERCASPLDDRRQRAREAFYDGTEPGDVVTIRALDGAIETATRARITPEVVAKFRATAEGWGGDFADALAEALTELGFEVER